MKSQELIAKWNNRSKPFVVKIYKVNPNTKFRERFFSTKKEAELFADQLLSNNAIHCESITLDKAIQFFMADLINDENSYLSKKMQADIHSHLRMIACYTLNNELTQLGSQLIKDFTNPKIQKFIEDVRRNNNGGFHVRRLRLWALTKLLDYCVKQFYIDKNPIFKAKISNHRSINESNIDALENHNPETIAEIIKNGGPYALHIQFACETGLRNSEMRALMWKDVDLFSNVVDVNKSFIKIADGEKIKSGQVYNSNEILTPGTKSGKWSTRKVYLRSDLLQKMISYKEKQDLLANHTIHRSLEDTDFVFPKEYDLLLPTRKERWGRYGLTPACEKSKLDHLRWHDLRHWFATYNISYKGKALKTISRLMGHKDVIVTEKIYSHLVNNDGENARLRKEFLSDEPKLIYKNPNLIAIGVENFIQS